MVKSGNKRSTHERMLRQDNEILPEESLELAPEDHCGILKERGLPVENSPGTATGQHMRIATSMRALN